MLEAVEAGVFAYELDGLKQERVNPIQDLTIMRFKAFEKPRREGDDALQARDERKSFDQAKGIIMCSNGVDEAEAYVVPCNYTELETSDLVVFVGSKRASCHPVLFQRLQAARESAAPNWW